MNSSWTSGRIFKYAIIIIAALFVAAFLPEQAEAAKNDFNSGFAMPSVKVDMEAMQSEPVPMTLQLLLYMSMLTVIPYLFICCTSFIRISIIISFLKSNLGLSRGVPKQVWVGLGLMLTMFVMAPVMNKAEQEAYQPFMAKQISYETFLKRLTKPVTEFMRKNTRAKDLEFFVIMSGIKPDNKAKSRDGHAERIEKDGKWIMKPTPQSIKFEKTIKNPPFHVLLAAFMISEIKTGFYIGFIIYLPFLCIDMITAATLMAMGMFMLSPMGFSLPCKMMCFVMIDGFEILCEGLVKSYRY